MDEPRRFRKLPVEVTAIRWTGENLHAVCVFIEGLTGPEDGWALVKRDMSNTDDLRVWIEKSDTWGTVRLGDWVLAERDGVGFYPCTAEQFADTYEALE